jgi:choline dehydrogenase-like flavoprotein
VLNIRLPEQAITVLEQARDQILSLLDRAGFEPKMSVWKIESAGSANHYAGTCRMHARQEFGMLNAWGRMHVADNMAVADSSAFTTNPEKNPVLTSMTLAARAADRLASEIKSGDL